MHKEDNVQIKSTPVEVIKERLWCTVCNNEMVTTGFSYPMAPPRYPHKCSNNECKTTIVKDDLYPRIAYKEIN